MIRKTPTISIIVAWHLTVFPATIVFLDWLLGHSLTVKGVTVKPGSFDMDRAMVEFLTNPFFILICLAILLVEGGDSGMSVRASRLPGRSAISDLDPI